MSDVPPADPPPDPPADPPAPPADPPAPPELGDPGKKALDEERTARKAAEKLARDTQAELDKLKTESLPDHEKAVKEAADAARADALLQVHSKLFAAEVKAAAAGKVADPDLFADPEVARRLLGLDEIPVTSEGDIDSEAISEAVVRMLEAKPYLASATPPGAAPPDLGQGARGAPSPKSLDQQIVDAETAGDWSLAGRLKLQKLAATKQP